MKTLARWGMAMAMAAGISAGTTALAESPRVLRSDNVYHGQTALIPDMVVAGNGDLIVTFSNHADVLPANDTLFVRSSDYGRTWSDVYLRYATENQAENGVMVCGLIKLPNDALLACRVEIHMPGGQLNRHQTAKIEILKSSDHGQSFEPISALTWPAGQLAAPYGPMVRLDDGAVIMPGFIQNVGNGYWQSEDNGHTWSDFKVVWTDPPAGAENHLWFNETAYEALGDGVVIAVARNDFNELFYQIDSHDNGRTWSEPRALNIIGGSPALHRTASGSVLLAYRDGSRLGLSVAESIDGGKNWRYLYRLDTPDGVPVLDNPHWDRPDETTMWQPGEGNVGYPALVDLPDGTIYVVWHVHNPNSPPAAAGRDTFGLVGNVLSNPAENDALYGATVFPVAQTGIILRAQSISGSAGVADLVHPSAGLGFAITPLRITGDWEETASASQVIYVISGEAQAQLNDRPVVIGTGDVIVMNAGDRITLGNDDHAIELLRVRQTAQ